MKATDIDEACNYVRGVLGVDLKKHLKFGQPQTFNNFSVLGSVIVLYRYAEAIGQPIILHDMTTGGHQSHHLGTELDFDLKSKRKDAVKQAHITADLLRIRQAIRSKLNAFRIGFYFDYFKSEAAKGAESFEKFKEEYGSKRVAYSMHLGARYQWSSQEFVGNPIPSDAAVFGIWGRGSKGYKQSGVWTRRFLKWNIGFLKSGCQKLATETLLKDFRTLDDNPPPLPTYIA